MLTLEKQARCRFVGSTRFRNTSVRRRVRAPAGARVRTYTPAHASITKQGACARAFVCARATILALTG